MEATGISHLGCWGAGTAGGVGNVGDAGGTLGKVCLPLSAPPPVARGLGSKY